jgi:hypothetical protein
VHHGGRCGLVAKPPAQPFIEDRESLPPARRGGEPLVQLPGEPPNDFIGRQVGLRELASRNTE